MTEKEISQELIKKIKDDVAAKKVVLGEGGEGRIINAVGEALISNLVRLAAKCAKESEDGVGTVTFQNLIDVNVSNRVSEDGEKDGNLMVSFVPGPQAKLLAKQDDATEDVDE